MVSAEGSYDLVIRAERVVTPQGERAAAVAMVDGAIALVTERDAPLQAAREVTLADDEALLPGVVDSHVHINEPGRTEWEGFESATRAAAAGGTTTIVDMPLNSIPATTTVPALQLKLAAAEGKLACDVAFLGGAVPDNVGALRELREAGVVAYKSFLTPSGVDEFANISRDELFQHCHEIARCGGMLMVHAEDPAVIDGAAPPHGRSYPAFVASRPPEAEMEAVGWCIDAARRTGAHVHIVHVSSDRVLPLLAQAKAEGVSITAETCPHYLHFAAEQIPDGGTQYKCCPPIRGGATREALWEGLRSGALDWVASDHSPATVEVKDLDTGDFETAWGGIASVQLLLNVVWDGARQRGFGLADLARWISERPAAACGLTRKGRIEAGCDADVVVFAPEARHLIQASSLQHKNPVTPYDGVELVGVVRATYLRGRLVEPGQHRGQVVLSAD